MTRELSAFPLPDHDPRIGQIFPLAPRGLRRRQYAAVLGSVVIVVLPWIVVFLTTSRRQLPPVIASLGSYTVLMTVSGVAALKRLFGQWRNARVIISAGGIVHEMGDRREAVRWDQVTGIEVRRDAGGTPVQIELQGRHERPVHLRGFADMPALAAKLESHLPVAAR